MNLSPDAERLCFVQRYSPRPQITGVEFIELRRFNDEGGSMTELGRLAANGLMGAQNFTVAQINYNVLEPGAIKAFHLHRRQTDIWFVPPEDKMLLVLVDVRNGSPSEAVQVRIALGDGVSRLVRIPPGVAHGVRNLAAARGRIIYFTDLHFSPDPAACDEGRLPWDYLGAEVWEAMRG
jgi:dTDP-4-dehydrorhamnose 3,5-epimerase